MTDRHGRKKNPTIERGIMNIFKAVRKPFEVDCVQVTAENLEEVAEWCQGDIRLNDKGDGYVKVRVHSPLTERQTKAFAGDWVLYANKGYKVYTEKAFDRAFELENVAETNHVLDNNEPRSGYDGPVPQVNAGLVEGTIEKVQFFGAISEEPVE
jgi:hypothetical protein